MTTPTTLDRSELLRKNPRVDAAKLAEIEAALAEMARAGLVGSHYGIEPALGAPRKSSRAPDLLLNQTTHLGE